MRPAFGIADLVPQLVLFCTNTTSNDKIERSNIRNWHAEPQCAQESDCYNVYGCNEQQQSWTVAFEACMRPSAPARDAAAMAARASDGVSELEAALSKPLFAVCISCIRYTCMPVFLTSAVYSPVCLRACLHGWVSSEPAVCQY